MIETLKPIIQAQPFFAGFSDAMTDLIVGCAENVRFAAGGSEWLSASVAESKRTWRRPLTSVWPEGDAS